MKLLKKQGMNLCFAAIVAVLAAMPLLLQSGVLTAKLDHPVPRQVHCLCHCGYGT